MEGANSVGNAVAAQTRVDAALLPQIERVFREFEGCGARKVRRQMVRARRRSTFEATTSRASRM